MATPLKVLFAASEVNPLAKVGGLADVVGSLPGALRHKGAEVRIALPHYATIDSGKYGTPNAVTQYDVTILGRSEHIEVKSVALKDGTPVYLLGNKTYFERKAVYGELDDLERFLLFSIAVAELPARIGWKPDVLHCHDWHTGLAPALWKKKQLSLPREEASASVFTIHNLGYQGWFDDWFAGRAGLYEFLPPPSDPLRAKVYSLMGIAILASDAVSTVSPTYAREILTPEYGFKLEEALQRREADLYGILNGVDYSEFSPDVDPLIPYKFDQSDLEGKAKDKAVLQEKVSLARDSAVPVAGMVGRLADQKGLDLVAQALGPVLDTTNLQFVLLGSGEEKYRQALEALSFKYPYRMRLISGFNLEMAQLIYSGCDLFVMPSRYEPCGLGQLIALRYGTIPVVRQTGGLADSIQDAPPTLSKGNGFVFKEYEAQKLVDAIKRAADGYSKKAAWKKLMVRAMKADFSWDVSAGRYMDMYQKAIEKARSPR